MAFEKIGVALLDGFRFGLVSGQPGHDGVFRHRERNVPFAGIRIFGPFELECAQTVENDDVLFRLFRKNKRHARYLDRKLDLRHDLADGRLPPGTVIHAGRTSPDLDPRRLAGGVFDIHKKLVHIHASRSERPKLQSVRLLRHRNRFGECYGIGPSTRWYGELGGLLLPEHGLVRQRQFSPAVHLTLFHRKVLRVEQHIAVRSLQFTRDDFIRTALPFRLCRGGQFAGKKNQQK